MGTYTKSCFNRTARPRSERLRELGGLIVPVSASAAAGGSIVPTGADHTHANLADLNRISVTDGYIYLTDEVIDQDTQEVTVVTTKAMAGYADRAGANADGYTLDWFIPVTVNGSLTLKLNPIYAGLWAEGWISAGGIGSGGGGGGSTVVVTQILSAGTAIATISVDGVSTTLYAPQGGGTTVTWGTADGYVIPLTVGGTTKNLLLSGALTGYATQSWVTGQGYLVSSDLSSYATQTWVGQQGYATQTWVGQQGFLTSSSLTNYATQSWVQQQGYLTSSSLTGYATESWVTNRGYITSSALTGYATESWVHQQGYLTSYTEQYQGTVTSVTLTSGTGITVSNSGTAITSSGSRTISISSTYRTYISHGETAYGWGDHSEAGYVHLAGAETITGIKTFTNSLYGKTSASNTDPDWYIDNDGSASFDNLQVGGTGVVTIANAQTITGVKTFSNGLVTAGISATADIIPSTDLGAALGYSDHRFTYACIKDVYSETHWFKNPTTTKICAAIYGNAGYFRFRTGADIDTARKDIVFHESYGFYPDQAGVNLGYNGASFRWATIYGVNADFTGTVTVNGINSIDQSNANMSLYNYGARGSKSFDAYGNSINFRVHDPNNQQVNILAVNASAIQAGSSIIPNYVAGLNLGGNTSSTRWSNIYGVNADLTGDLTLDSASHIDIGPLRLQYDSANKALRVTKKSGSDTTNYGLYADGFITAGGVGGASSEYVKYVSCTQSEYNALQTKDASTIYAIGSPVSKVYIGSLLLFQEN